MEPANDHVVAILTRAPSAGGKTRLFAELMSPPAPELLRALLLDTLDGVSACGARVVIAVTPASAVSEIEDLVGARAMVFAQPEGDLGDRMRGTLEALFQQGARAVAVVGSDVPSIDAGVLRDTFTVLHQDEGTVVLGPAVDGGYYLLGVTAVPDLFQDIDWGGPEVLRQTMTRARAAGLRIQLVDTLGDVDSVDSLRALTGAAPRTREWCARHGLVNRSPDN